MPRSLRTKIITGFAVVVLLVTFVSAWTVTNIIDINDRAAAIVDGDFKNIAIANRVRTALARYNFTMLRYVSFHTDSLRGQIAAHQEEFHHWIEEWRRSASDSAEQADLDSIAMDFRNLNAVGTELIEELAARHEGGNLLYATSYLPVYEELIDRLNWQREQNHDRSVALIESIGASARFIAISTVIIAAAVLVLSIVASQKVLQIVLKPIRELTLSARRIAEGDFRHEITVGSSDDELSGLIRHFNVMIRQLREYDQLKASQIVAEQRRCETIVRDLTDVVVATDEDHRVIYFNREAEHVIGLAAASVIGRPLEELTAHGAMMRRMLDDVNADVLDGAERLVTLHVGERERAYTYEAQTIGNDAGAVIGYMFRLKDITRFKQLDEIKTKMVSTVSHELRTPLTSMGMSLELMMEDDMRGRLDPVQLELLGNMQEDVKRLQLFVNDLLDLSRIESGRMRLNIRPISPRGLAEAAVQQVVALASRQEIQIDTTGIGRDLPDVMVDPDRVAQVFNNLFSNAIRYTPFRGTIAVSAVRADDTIRFCVRDNGPGIPAGEERQIFEKFYQVRDDQRAGGSGLGLAIVKEILDAHGGTVWVESAVGWGSSFYFTLPVGPAGEDGSGGALESHAPMASPVG